jgi:hypothetical protein
MGCNCGNKTKVTSGVPTVNGLPDMCSCGKPKNECCCNKPKNICCDEPKPCKQSHDVTLVQSVYTTTVEATNSWAMPAVDDCVQLHLKDVVNILPGAILWNQSVGQLKVSSYDSTTGYVLACNNGEEGNAEEGTAFPSCMSFHVGIPVECNCDDDYAGVCLAADMTSPGEGETTEVSVTTVSGLFIGDVIDIAGYMYRITAINDVNTITVRNEGFGAPIGTVIKNDPNCTGKKCTVKITVVNSDDPCIKEPVNEGVIIVCEDGERKPFEGTADSQIAVWDNEDKKWKLKTVKLEDECTNITVDVTLEPLISLYIVNVVTTSIFNVGDIVHFAGHKFKVHSKVNSTQMRIELQDTISAITVVEEGEEICLGDCCEMIEFPEAYSGFTTGDNTMRFTIDNTSVSYELNHSNPTKDVSNDLPTITLAYPSSGATKVTIIGSITIVCQGQFWCVTHTANGVSGGAHTTYKYLSWVDAPASEFLVRPKLNGTTIYGSTYNSSGKKLHLLVDDDQSTDPSPRIYSHFITIPIVATINASGSSTITFDAKLEATKLIDMTDSEHPNEKSAVSIQRLQTTVALAWILQ